MELDAFGLGILCILEMAIAFSSPNFSHKIGLILSSTGSCSLVGANSHRLFRQLKREHLLMSNGRK